MTRRPRVAVVGGAVAGLAAAERLRGFATVDLYERGAYDDREVRCGEAINEAGLVPLSKTPEHGFHQRIDAFHVDVHRSTDRPPGGDPLGTARIPVARGYVTDRDVVERRWAERLREDPNVTVHESTNVTRAGFADLRDAHDAVVDATGLPALSLRATGRADRYTGDMVALNADVRGDFAGWRRRPRIVVEGYTGYFWAFPKSAARANVGIGWAGDDRPDDHVAALHAACDRAGVPRPPRDAIGADTIPRGPNLPPALAHPDPDVYLVGDAAGVANRYQGEGICQSIRSASLLADLLRAGRGDEYPRRLYALFRAEYRLAALMRAVWEATRDPDLLAAVTRAVDGLSVTQVTREPRAVVARLARRPHLLARLLGEPGMRRQVVDAARDRWEFGRAT